MTEQDRIAIKMAAQDIARISNRKNVPIETLQHKLETIHAIADGIVDITETAFLIKEAA